MPAPSASWCWNSGWYPTRGPAGEEGALPREHPGLGEAGWRRLHAAAVCLTWGWNRSFVRRVPSVLFTFCPSTQDRARCREGAWSVSGEGEEWPQALSPSSGSASAPGNPDQLPCPPTLVQEGSGLAAPQAASRSHPAAALHTAFDLSWAFAELGGEARA